MAPEFGSTCGIFPVDEETLNYLRLSGRSAERIALVEAYAKAQGLFRTKGQSDPVYTDTLSLDLGTVVPTLAGPRRPHDKVALTDVGAGFKKVLPELLAQAKKKAKGVAVTAEELATRVGSTHRGESFELGQRLGRDRRHHQLHQHLQPVRDAGRRALGQKCRRKGSAGQALGEDQPGSRLQGRDAVPDRRPACLPSLEQLHFNVVGYGCTTCIGNSGPLPETISKAISDGELVAVSVLSGNRNFEGRVSPDVRANYLASPPLVVAYALAGRIDIDFATEPLGKDKEGNDVFLKDIWPSPKDVAASVKQNVTSEMFRKEYARRVQRRRALARAAGAGRRPLRLGSRRAPTSASPRSSRTCRSSRRRSPTSRARACWRRWATRSRPTTSRPPATSPRPRRPPNT